MMKKKLAAILAAVLLGSMMVPGTVAFAQVNDPGTAVSTEAAEDTAASESTEEVTENASEKSEDASAADDENEADTDLSEEAAPDPAGDLTDLITGAPELFERIMNDMDPEVIEILLENPKLLKYFLPTLHVMVTDTSVTITFKETEPEDPKQTGTVTTNGSNLRVRTGPSIDYEIISSLANGSQIEVIGEEDGWYRIVFPAEYAWVCGQYVRLNEVKPTETENGYSFDITGEMLAELISSLLPETTEEPAAVQEIHGLTPSGNLTLVDDYGEQTGEGQQFITLVTKAGNYFYLIIDRDEKGEETVHFLNLVDERDLLSLMEDDEKADYESQIAAEQASKEDAEKAAAESQTSEEPGTEADTPSRKEDTGKKSTNMLPVLLIVLLIAGAGGGWFYLQTKKKKQAKNAPDPDADYDDDDEEDYGAGPSCPYIKDKEASMGSDPYEDEILDDPDESSDDGEEDM